MEIFDRRHVRTELIGRFMPAKGDVCEDGRPASSHANRSSTTPHQSLDLIQISPSTLINKSGGADRSRHKISGV